MSIIVGKRNFVENFGNMRINDFPQDSHFLTKMVLTENSTTDRKSYVRLDHSHNLSFLQSRFPYILQKEIATVLEDCDNNLEIATEILLKSQNKVNPQPLHIKPKPGRVIRTIVPIKESPQSPQMKNTMEITSHKEEKKQQQQDNSIQEEDPTAIMRIQEKVDGFMTRLGTLNHLDEVKDLLAQILFELKGDVERNNEDQIKKLQEHKRILIQAFNVQMQKVKVLEEKNKDLGILMTTHEQEFAKLKTINYKHELRLKELYSNNDISKNYDVY